MSVRFSTRVSRRTGVSVGPVGAAFVALFYLAWIAIRFVIFVLAALVIAVLAIGGGAYVRFTEREDPEHLSIGGYVAGLWKGLWRKLTQALPARRA